MPPTPSTDPACKIDCPKCKSKPGLKCVNYLGKGKQICAERLEAYIMGSDTTPPAPKPEPLPITPPKPAAADFTEDTPPPKVRPKGVSVGRYVTVPPGGVEAEFAEWDRTGRVPAGSVLARFVGTFDSPSGYKARGVNVPSDRLALFDVSTVVKEDKTGRTWVVLTPKAKAVTS